MTDAARPPVEIIGRVPGVESVQPFGDRAHVRIVPGAQAAVMRDLESAIPGAGIRPIVASLEDVFIDLITGHRT